MLRSAVATFAFLVLSTSPAQAADPWVRVDPHARPATPFRGVTGPSRLSRETLASFFKIDPTDLTKIAALEELLDLNSEDNLHAGALVEADLYDRMYCVWPEAWKKKAAGLNLPQRRKLIGEYYRLVTMAEDEFRPIGLSLDSKNNLTVNCLLCHVGLVNGQPYLGAPHTPNITLFEKDVNKLKVLGAKNQKRSSPTPSTTTLSFASASNADPCEEGFGSGANFTASFIEKIHGPGLTTNAFVYSLVLGRLHDPKDFSMLSGVGAYTGLLAGFNEAMKMPTGDKVIPWWRAAYNKQRGRPNYAAGIITIGPDDHDIEAAHFTTNFGSPKIGKDPKTGVAVRRVTELFSATKPPRDLSLAKIKEVMGAEAGEARFRRGQKIYEAKCSICHGTYDDRGQLARNPVLISMNAGTDPNLSRVSNAFAAHLKEVPAFKGKLLPQAPGYYVAPTLEGLASSAPYNHNGSVPSLRPFLLGESERPKYFRLKQPLPLGGLTTNGPLDAGYEWEAVTEKEAKENPRSDIYDTTFGDTETQKPGGYRNTGHPWTVNTGEVDDVILYLRTL